MSFKRESREKRLMQKIFKNHDKSFRRTKMKRVQLDISIFQNLVERRKYSEKSCEITSNERGKNLKVSNFILIHSTVFFKLQNLQEKSKIIFFF